MAEANRFAVATGNFSATSTWSLTSGGAAGASVPDTDQHAIIESGVNVTIDASDEIKSLTVNSGGTLTGNASYTLTINGEGDVTYGTNGYAVNIDGELSTDNTVNLTFTNSSSDYNIDMNPSNSNYPRSVTINSSGRTATLQGAFVCETDFTLTAGTLDTGSNYEFSVTGLTVVGAGGSEDAATLTCNDSAVSLGSGVTSGYGLSILQGGTFVGGGGAHTIGAVSVANHAHAKYTMTDVTTTINGGENGYAFNLQENSIFAHGSGTLLLDSGTTGIIRKVGTTLALNNLTVDMTANMGSAISVAGALNITAGTLDTTGSDYALTVSGITTLTGVLTLNGSVVSLGSAVTAGYAVTMAGSNTATFNGNAATVTMGSIGPSSTVCDINFSSVTTTFTSRNTSDSNNIAQLGGNTTFSMSSGEVIITTAAAGNLHFDPYGDKIFDLTINNGGNTVTLTDDTAIHGDVTITAGTIDTGANKELTVTGTTDVAGTLTCNASTCSFGSGVTSGYGLSVAVSGTFTGGSGTHTMGSLRGVGGSPGATITLSSGVTTIDSEYQSGNQVIEISSGINSWNNGSGTLTITTAAASNFVLNKSGATLNNFIINHSSADITLTTTALTVAGNMTITAGEFDTSGSNLALTVTGDCVVGTGTATLTLNDSVVELGALAIDSSTATVTATSGGTLNITTGSTSLPGESSSMSIYSDEGNINHAGTITITAGSYFDIVGTTSIVNNVIMDGGSYYVSSPTIGGDLTINASKQLLTYGGTQNLTVTGDLILNGRLNLTGGTSADVVCGSLTIASGGEYIAHASGTTTITSKTASAARALDFAGTFTHNNGTVKLALPATDWSNVYPNSAHFYNFIIDTGSSEGYYINDPLIVLNNLDVQDGTIYANSASSNDGDITVHGLTTVGTGADAAKLENVARTVTLHGGITVGANGTFETGTGTVNVGGIRNLGGTIS